VAFGTGGEPEISRNGPGSLGVRQSIHTHVPSPLRRAWKLNGAADQEAPFLLMTPELTACVHVKTEPSPVKSGGLKGSTQHWPAVYPPEFEIPRFVVAGY
jgi:hypothetical protein